MEPIFASVSLEDALYLKQQVITRKMFLIILSVSFKWLSYLLSVVHVIIWVS
jgi:hypothetical protein